VLCTAADGVTDGATVSVDGTAGVFTSSASDGFAAFFTVTLQLNLYVFFPDLI